MSRLLWAGVGAGGLGWYLWRNSERDKLASDLRFDPLYTELFLLDLVPSPDEAAEEYITYRNAETAETALAAVMSALPPLPLGQRAQVIQRIKDQTGVDVQLYLEQIKGYVPGVEKWIDWGDVEDFDEKGWGEWITDQAG